MLRTTLATLAAVMLAACAANKEAGNETQGANDEGIDAEQAIRDYIEIRQPTEQDVLRSSSSDGWTRIDETFVIYTTRHEAFLIEFVRRCYEMSETPVVPDVRRERNTIRARFDTLRGCRIHKIFSLNENDVAELTALGRVMDENQ
jgi:Family of unknown function (DUF6491)